MLSDGRAVQIRPIRRDDGEALRVSHARLSPETRYRRFLAAKPQLSSADARYLVEIDGSDHVALVATPAGEGGTIVAVARFVRQPDDPEAAEFAIVVGDAFHRQGLGTILLERLAQAALQRGVRRFAATTLADNVAIHRLMARLGPGSLTERRLGAISELEVTLAPRPALAARAA